MNYYEHHIGDYAEATLHLSFIEDAAYSRLIRKYYSTEKPLPADLKQVQRLVGARTREEKSAVETILEEFFILADDGWHNSRCDSEIEKFQSGEPEREVKKANETNRLKRHRDERAALFKRLTDAGHHAAWNIGIIELRELVKRYCGEAETTSPPFHATAPATPATATQAPSTRHQTPDTRGIQAAEVDQPPSAAADPIHGRAIELTAMLRKRGAALQASDPRLLRWAETGITDVQALAALETAQQRREEQGNHQPINAGYLDAILKDATGTGTPTKRRGNIHDERAATIAGLTGRDRKAEHGQVINGSAVVVD